MDEPTTTVIGEGQPPAAKPDSWMESLSDELRNEAPIQRFSGKPLDELAKSFIHAQSKMGQKGILKPREDSSKDEWDEYYTQLGRPKSAGEYELPKEGLPEGSQFDPDGIKPFMEKAHELGISKQQFAGLARKAAEVAAETQNANAEKVHKQRLEARQTLQREWGMSYEENIQAALNAVKQFGGDELVRDMTQADEGKLGLGDNPKVVAMLAKIGKLVAVDEILGSGSSRNFKLSPQEAKGEIAAMNADKQFMEVYQDARHPGHAGAVAKMQELYEAAFVGIK